MFVFILLRQSRELATSLTMIGGMGGVKPCAELCTELSGRGKRKTKQLCVGGQIPVHITRPIQIPVDWKGMSICTPRLKVRKVDMNTKEHR